VAPDATQEEEVEESTYDVPDDLKDPTGNAMLDAAMNAFVSVTGATLDDMRRAAQNAVERGDVTLIDKAFLAERFGEYYKDAYALAKAAVEHEVQQKEAQSKQAQREQAKATKLANEAAGGAENWKQATSVFNSTAPEKLKAAVKTLLNSGQVEAGVDLVLSHVQNSGQVPNVKNTLQGGAALGNVSALSAEQFKQEMTKLRTEAGAASLESGPWAARYNQLLTRRSAGKKLGT
jgi:hypothetical protein